MAYLGNDLQVAFPTYRNIDDISGSFNGVTTSFPLTVAGVAPIPAPINSQQCLISVNGVVQRPDDSGTEGFRLSGGDIIFASAPAGGVDFFGVILAGADYVNIGANFPSGTAVAPSITFDSDLDTGIYNPAGNQIGFTTSGVQRLVINSSGQVSGGLGTAAAPVISFISDPNTGIYSPGADQVAISTGGSGRLFVDASGNVGVNAATPNSYGAGYNVLTLNGSTSPVLDLNVAGTRTATFYSFSTNTLIGTQTATPLQLITNGTEKLRIDSSGRLLVGTSSASGTNTLFESSSTTANAANVALVKQNSGTADQAGQQLHFYNFGPAGTARAADTEVGSMRFYGSQPTSGAAQEMARITCAADLIQTGTNTSGRLVFSTTADGAASPTERMRITQWGGLWLGTSTGSNSYKLTVEGTNSGGVSGGGIEARCAGAGDANFYSVSSTIGYHFYGSGTGTFYVENDGDVRNTNNSYGAISDQKLKENIVDANSQWDDIKALQVRKYNFKEGQTHTQIGLVAQEVELVSPGLVTESPDRDAEGNDLGTTTKSVNYSVLYMKAVKALQETMERIEQLESEMAAVKAQLP